MSILIVTQTYHPTANGQGAFTVHLAEGLALAGFEVHVLAPSAKGRAAQVWRNGVRLHEVTSLSLKPLADNVHVPFLSSRQVEAVIEEVQPQIVHIQDHYPLCRHAVDLARKRDLPILGTNHFLPGNILPYIPLLSSFETGRRFLSAYMWKMVMVVYNRLDLVVAPTHSAAEILRQNGLDAPLQAISNGVQLNRFKPCPSNHREEILRRYGLDPERDIFLYVGRVDRDKDLDTLVEAAGLLGSVPVQVGIAGRGNCEAHLEKRLQDSALDGRVVLCGFIPNRDLPDLYRSVDAFVMPSLVELQSIASLEAMASGLPVLAACAGALPEIVRPGKNGYLFAPHDAQSLASKMRELVGHPEQRKALRQESLKMARLHDFQNTLMAYQGVYRKLNPSIELHVGKETLETDCLGCW